MHLRVKFVVESTLYFEETGYVLWPIGKFLLRARLGLSGVAPALKSDVRHHIADA